MDVHVRRAVTNALRERGVDVLTARADGARELPDPALLDRATDLGRVRSARTTICWPKPRFANAPAGHLLVSFMPISFM